MALLVPCPNCGPRPHTEFAYGGEERPHLATDAESDFARVLLPENVAGTQRERWFHARGCRIWLTLTRDTRTDRIG